MTTDISETRLKHLRNITLYDQSKVAIYEPEWPSMTRDKHRRDLPLPLVDELVPEVFRITVRRNADGRVLAYGSREQDGERPKRRGGEVLDAERAADLQEVVAAIRRVGDFLEAPEACVEKCIAGLPPRRL
jgi:hypothetical protein